MTDAQSEIAREIQQASECTCGTHDAYTHCKVCGAAVCEQCAVNTVEGVWCVGCAEMNREVEP